VGGRPQPLSIRDETRETAGKLMPQIVKRIEKAIKNSEVLRETGEELIAMVKINIYLIELSYMHAADGDGGIREADQPPAVLRLSLVGGR
jgi:hypothetical protein